ncbi:adenylate/guanylate cyclase domain-containing protein [Methylocystis sp. MJC1]|jgi:adenylate cyclase|uniref:CHASE2 domain-containing protein n=1 Tax=Methylocystis sp. MJC1 TaxID=2654282 RepID=UPI0013EAC39D|nr:adenylate/guanylate cyclase domain-containing protein [Methylocystis sp. MJC1]KAF2992757.1 Adenylate cyclase 1 [Methylocystis sp. MJC1]MBU6526720.1 adenylate/guanylate cyclase domain-containing protein [Methylocystis sp. MJC1]UZX13156.1 adenylate/guanylate cyclase domain-containing protein [Methylocystis sp. MJC1]
MFNRTRIFLLSSLLAAALVLPWGALQPPALDDLRNLVFDNFQRAAPRAYDREAPVRVIGVDEESLKAYGQWPWPRTRLAELVDRLRELGAAVIAFDFIFSEPDRTSPRAFIQALADTKLRTDVSKLLAKAPDGDMVFASALKSAPVVLGATLAKTGATDFTAKAGFVTAGDDPAPFLYSFPAVVLPLPGLIDNVQGVGATNWLPDRDLVVRRVPLLSRLGAAIAPSLALEALRVAQGEPSIVVRSSNASGQTAFGAQTGVNAVKVGAFQIATGPNAEVRPRYSYSAPARDISAKAVLENQVPRSEIDGRIIFVGALAVGIGDVRATPLEPVAPGVDVHAQIVESLASGALLSRPDWAPGLEYVSAIVAFALTMPLLFAAPQLLSAAFATLAVGAFFGGSFYLFEKQGLLLDPVYPSLVVIGAYVVGAVTLWRTEILARRQVRRAFGKFVAPAVVDRIAEHPERLVLGGETRELTVLFSDLRNFSGISEGMSARELTQFMNDYLTPMTDAILECEGTVDKYMGDAILAFWNAPLDVADHPRKAVEAALRMRGEIARFNARRAQAAQEAGRRHVEAAMGLGLNIGSCSVGNMGSIRRFDYSILGDNVNLASRLEGASKAFSTDIIASGAVRDAVPDMAWLDLGRIVVAGRSEATQVFALAGNAEFAKRDKYMRWRTIHEAMRAQYESGRFDAASESAAELAQVAPGAWPALYVAMGKRYSALAQEGLHEGWSSVWNLLSK